MRYIIIYILSLVLFGCGTTAKKDENSSSIAKNDENSSPATTQSTQNNIIKELDSSLLYQQWAIHKDTDFYNQNAIDDDASIHAESIYDKYTGKGVVVAIIDDGFDITHPEIKDKIIKTINVDNNANISTDVSYDNNNDYHGTAVSGIIASANDGIGVRGLAPDVKLILIKMPTELSDEVVIELFKQAVDNGADIISCSWGTGEVSDAVKEYINDISSTARDNKGVIVVFASGNDNATMTNDESAIESVIGVGATDKDNLRTIYSDYGKYLDIVAPGGYYLGITTIDPVGAKGISSDEYNRYDEFYYGEEVSFMGTSASAPLVSASIALALEKNRFLTRVDIQNLLKKSADHIGINTPYIDDMISSSSKTPTITGIFGTIENNNIKVRLISKKDNHIYGKYSIDSYGDNSWSCSVTDELEEGNYTIEVISDDESVVWCTDTNFEINTTKIDKVDKEIKKSDFYGFGKINVEKMIGNLY